MYDDLQYSMFESLSKDCYRLDNARIRRTINQLSANGEKTSQAHRTRTHYANSGDMLWVSMDGVCQQADTLLLYIENADKDGFSLEKLGVREIKETLEQIRNLDFGNGSTSINTAYAKMEYLLTKAFLTYGVGMRYGLTNPRDYLNKFDVHDSDSVHVNYNQVFDIPTHVCGKQTYKESFDCIRHDSVGEYMRASQMVSPQYQALREMLPGAGGKRREKILVNMERARWKTPQSWYSEEEYVVINVPAFYLWAATKEDSIEMRVACGATKTKTPLLHSSITHMNINPQWVVPRSVIKNEMMRHAGDSAYFARNHFFARNKVTGDVLHNRHITSSVLANTDYTIIQEGGVGNSLGRIIFRFPNNFSVYLHDTTSKSVFSASRRNVSHGCIRVENPYELALFLMREEDMESDVAQRLKYSMEEDISSDGIDHSKLMHTQKVEPQIPVFIEYYTLFLTPKGDIREYNDVYGYDDVIMENISPYV